MIFISYRISDSLDLVGRLDADLTRELGPDSVFRDKSRLEGGHDWTAELEHNARDCKVMLVVIGATWQTASFTDDDRRGIPRLFDLEDWVRKEITLALDAGKTVIPVFVNGAAMPAERWLERCGLERLYKRQGEPLRNSDYENDLAKLIAVMRKRCPDLPSKQEGYRVAKRLPVPPDLYAVPNYILTSTFIGRATELDELDAWARSPDPLMVVEGIGGLGKSALTWEWVQKRATRAIPHLAGRVWWSFYERGSSMAAFVRHALAYITGQDADALSTETAHYDRCQELLTQLQRRPFLLVLDGFERVLTAYHRWDKAQQRDDQIDAGLRGCVEPRDGEFLQQLLECKPSKILVSTRLFPGELENRASARPICGVAHHHLNGLSRPDALAFFRHAGIRGSEQAMLDFADQFGRHSLLLKVVCGEIANYPRRPFHFDTWRDDPIYGGKLRLSELDLKQRYNHILRFALDGLDEPKRKLLCRIAVLSENITYDTLAVLNPYLPPRPAEVKEPENPEQSWNWKYLSEEERRVRLADYPQAQDAYRRYQQALQAYLESAEYRQAVRDFDNALKELQDRGLLQWDRDSGHYDMHPVVRGHAAELLEEGDRKQTFLAVRDHFAALPPDDLKQATELSHVAHSLEIYRCLVGAGLFDEAARFYRGDLANTLFYHLGAYTLLVELVTPLFRGGRDGLPCLASSHVQVQIVNDLAIAFRELARHSEALPLFAKVLRSSLEAANWRNAAIDLRKIANSSRALGRHAESAAALAMARGLAEAAGKGDYGGIGRAVTVLDTAREAIEQGDFIRGEQLLSDFRAGRLPPIEHYRPGEAEYLSCLSRFYQGVLSEHDWQRDYEFTVQSRTIHVQYLFLALRAEWLLTRDQAGPALVAIDEALKIANRLGTPRPAYHDLRAWALARLGRAADARGELQTGEQRRFAAEAWRTLGDRERARACALNAYRWAWGEGPPYIHWYEVERSRALLSELGEPEPQLPPFDPTKVNPIPYEQEIRAAIERLKAEKAARSSEDNEA